MGRITRFAYDRLSRLVAVVLPNPATGANPPLVDGASPEPGALVTRYAYDEQGNKISQTDAEGRITRWTFDGMGRQRSRVLPLGQQEQFEYDAGGQPSAILSFNGERIETTHDNLGRIATLTLPGGHVRRFSYSASGQVSQIDDHGAVYGFEYDTRDRLTRAVDPQGRAIDYRYDAVGNRTELNTARQQIRYAFDELHRLREVVAQLDGGPAQTTEYRYDAVGNRSGMTNPNGTTVEYGYDLRNRLNSLVHRARQAAGAAVLLGLTYTVDASGLRTEIAETRPGTTTAITRTSAYTYDWVKRLTREQVTGTNSQARTSTWTYDKVGNRRSESTFGTFSKSLSYTYDANDRLTRESGSPATYDYSYDAAGNLLEKKQGSTVLASYRWSAEGRLLGATLGSGVNQVVTAYQYDPSGIRRSQEAVTGGIRSRTEYLVDPNQAYAQVLEDWEASAPSANPLPTATLGNVYLHGDDLISQTLLANNQATSTQIYHYDGLGSTRALSQYAVDASGNPLANHGQISDRYAYTAFGEADPAGTSGNNTNATENAYRYTGEQLDPNLGFYYLRARYMDPRGGRFLGMDAFGGYGSQPQSLHKYAYTHFNPINNIDPSGLYNLAESSAAQSGMSTLALHSIRTATINTARVAANDAFWATAANGAAIRTAGVGIMTGLAIAAISQRSSPRDRLIGVPIIVFGQEFPEHAEHIRDAQTASGSNFVVAPFALNRAPAWPRGWYNVDAVVECNKEARARLPGRACDEYPFATTRQGGPVNYVLGGVSLRLLSLSESNSTRNFIAAFYSRARLSPDGISKESRFMAFGVPGIRSFYTDRDGNVHFFGR